MSPIRGQHRTRAARLNEAAKRPGRDDREALQSLRHLLLGAEQERIERLETVIQTPEEMARLLPEVVASASEQRQRDLAIALGPSVAAGVEDVARRDPEMFGEILAPTIGTAVRRAVADALAAMLQRLNQMLEQGLSIRSLRWRIEARRSGRPYSEVVLLHTLVFRVERVLLVHRETGLVLEEVSADAATAQTADQLSSMLRALSAFASEAFRDASPGGTLRSFDVGDLTVWVEHDPLVMLVAVVRGVTPEWLRERLRETAARIRVQHADDLIAFRSDVSPFASTRPALLDCLHHEVRAPPRRAQIVLKVLGAALLVGLVVLGIERHLDGAGDASTRRAYRAAFEHEPGVHLTSIARTDRGYRIVGLRDPLAEPAETIVERARLPAAEIALEPFYSLDPRIVERRVRRALAPPPGVELVYRDGTLRVSGRAPARWIERSQVASAVLPGVDRYEDTELRSDEAIAELIAATAALAAVDVRFARDSTSLGPRQAAEVVARARRAVAAARAARADLCIELVGHTDDSGSSSRNQQLRAARAHEVADALAAEIPDVDLRPRPAGADDVEPGARRVALRATYSVDRATPACPP